MKTKRFPYQYPPAIPGSSHNPNRVKRGLSQLAAVGALAMACPAQADTYTWISGGTGNWDSALTDTSRWGAAQNTLWTSGAGGSNVAVFNVSGSPTITVGAGKVWTNGITFTQTATISSSTINLAGTTPTITLGAKGVITSALAGSNGVTVTSTGGTARDLNLSGASTGLSGAWHLGAGVRVMAQSNSAFGTGAVYLDSTSANVDFGVSVGAITVANDFYIKGANQGGALFIRNGSTISGAVHLTGNATILTLGANTISGVISNDVAGTLTLDFSNTLSSMKLSNANTYTGTTSFTSAAGTLILANANAVQNSTLLTDSTKAGIAFDSTVASKIFTIGGLSGSHNIALQDNAGSPAAIEARVGNNNANTTYSGVLSGAGSLTKIGAGTLTLSNANTYTGITSIQSGTLAVNGSLAAASAVSVSAGATLSGNGTVGGSVSVDGGTVNGSSLVLAGNATFAGASTFSGAATVSGSATVTSGSLVIAGSLTGNAHVNTGGALVVNNTLGGTADIDAGGLLGGTGSLTGLATVSGTLAPGAPGGTGTLTVNGGLTLASGATFAATATGTGAGQVSQLAASGPSINLSGSTATLSLATTGGFTPKYTVLGDFTTSDKLVLVLAGYQTGQFANVVSMSDPFWNNGNAFNGFTDKSGNTWAVFYGVNSMLPVNPTQGYTATGNDVVLLAIPEPTTWAMLVGSFGLLAFGQRLRGRRR
ncbi:MAG: autotransporter-associated beta strand repeat-containing protein [Verrucomicrobiota bacterium]